MDQLTIEGRAVPHELVVELNAPLSGAQRDVLAIARREGRVATMDAGRLVHAQRHGHHACTCPTSHVSSDGWSLLARLSRRGLVRHHKRGLWRARRVDE